MTADPLNTFDRALQQLRQGALRPHDFSALARGVLGQLPHLPPRYGQVLGDLLDRLESSALFSDESCSFSQRDLIEYLQTWLAKARQPPHPQPATQPPQPDPLTARRPGVPL